MRRTPRIPEKRMEKRMRPALPADGRAAPRTENSLGDLPLDSPVR